MAKDLHVSPVSTFPLPALPLYADSRANNLKHAGLYERRCEPSITDLKAMARFNLKQVTQIDEDTSMQDDDRIVLDECIAYGLFPQTSCAVVMWAAHEGVGAVHY